MNIKTALIFIIVSLLILSSAVFYYFSIADQVKIFENEYEKYMQTSIESFRFGIELSLKEDNFESLTEILYLTQSQKDVYVTVLIDKDRKGKTELTALPEDFQGSLEYIKKKSKYESLTESDTVFKIINFEKTNFKGAVAIGFSTTQLQNEIRESSFRTLFRLLVFLLVGIIIASIFSNSIVKPLGMLRNVAYKIGLGIIKIRADESKGGKDIRILAKTFNSMLDKLNEIQKQRITELSEYNQSLEYKNEQILSSIRYAQTIQHAILPESNNFKLINQDFFIIYRPKDIVSGDFYWVENVGKTLFIAVGDCTGHGVPGAMISMMGTILLNEIILKEKYTDPGDILLKLNSELNKALGQTGDSSTQDGMDIGLFTINIDTNESYYSGAFRNLFIVKDGELREYKGNKFHIGGFSRRKNKIFTTHQVEFEKSCNYYLSTDGFTDQVGTNSRKFGTKQLKNELKQICTLDFTNQKSHLELQLDKHMGDQDQRDDITIIGFRI
jgi:serine phosphatase RsbU (regulator of sigma subunit)